MVEKFKHIISSIENSRGEFLLFAVLRMDNFVDKWTVIISAEWINDQNREEVFNLLASRMRSSFDQSENASIARIGIFSVDDHVTTLLLKYKEGAHLVDEKVNGFIVHEAHILRSRQLNSQEGLPLSHPDR